MKRNARQIRLTVALFWTLSTLTTGALPAFASGGLAAIDAFNVGRHHLAAGNQEQALEAFNDALRMNPQFVQAYVARGKLLAEMGQHTAALSDLNFALQLQPTHAEGFAYRGFALFSLNRPEEALADFDFALRLDPSYARVHYLRAQTLQSIGDDGGFEAARAIALRLDPTIERVQQAAAALDPSATDSGVVLASPTVPERTSIMPSPYIPEPSKPKNEHVVRYQKHPILANLAPPSVSQPREMRDYPTTMPSMPREIPATAARPIIRPNDSAMNHPRNLQTGPMVEPSAELIVTEPVIVEQPVIVDKPLVVDEPLVIDEPVIVEMPIIEQPVVMSPPTVVDDETPPPSKLIAGVSPNGDYTTKPLPEVSEQRVAAALEATKQAVAEVKIEPLPSPAAEALASDMPGDSAAQATDAVTPLPQPAAEEVHVAAPAVAATAPTESSSGMGDMSAAVIADDSTTELDEAVRSNPADLAARRLRGESRLQTGLYAAAIADFDEVLKLDPSAVDALYGRARAKYLAGRPAEALDDYTSVLRNDDQHAAALIERGHCYAQLGRLAEAADDRYAALALNPSLAKTGPKYEVAESTAAAAAAAVASDESAAPISESKPSAFGNLFTGPAPVHVPVAAAAEPTAPSGVVMIDDEFDPAPQATPAFATDSSPLEVAVRELSAELAAAPGDAKLYVLRAQAFMALERFEDANDDVTATLRIDPNSKSAQSLRERIQKSSAASSSSPVYR